MQNIDSFTHTRGASIYLDDIPVLQGTLYAACYDSKVAHGLITNLDISEAAACEGVVKIFTAKDITGENQIGGIIPDEPLFADHHVHFSGMPIALVVATSDELARAATKKIKVSIDPLPVITDPRVAAAKGELIVPPRTFAIGDCEAAWEQCDYVIAGTADSNGQEHLYIETQGAYAVPVENGSLKIYSSTQGPTAVQRAVSKVTGLGMHQLEIDVTRLGGGFGGKEDQANTWAALCGLAAHVLRRPVKYALSRMDDMRMTGKRHPYSTDYKIGLNKELQLIAFEATYYQNAGAAADLSPAIMERTLFHCTNTYFIPNVKATALSCRTHLPPNTAFRGFGGPQALYVMECAITQAAETIGVPVLAIQEKNLVKTGDVYPYGQAIVSEAKACWDKALKVYDLQRMETEVAEFNAAHRWKKKGLSVMPICFGISFTNTMMNQARSLVHVYTDGSVVLTTGAIEMGQGVNTKMVQVAAQVFGIAATHIKVSSTNTFKIANTSPSAASATADLNGKATQIACTAIVARMKTVVAEQLKCAASDITISNGRVFHSGEDIDMSWAQLAALCYTRRISLSEHGHYATPDIHFDKTKEKGHPFAYHVFGTAITTVTLDCLRGIYEVDAVQLVHDFGSCMNPMIDRGQIEGGLVQGIGWMTLEEIVYDANGILKSNALSTYKVPDIYSVPKKIEINFLETELDNLAIFRSKAVGEPPLMYGIGTYFAIRQAVKAFNPAAMPAFDAPFTPEKVLMALYPQKVAALQTQPA